MVSAGGKDMRKGGKGRSRRRGPVRRFVAAITWLVLVLSLGSMIQVVALRFIDPPFSSFMLARQLEAATAGEWGYRVDYRWRDARDVSPHLAVAVIASEDQRFAQHHGFDLEAIRDAAERNARGGRLRGASTISQQTAKNLFLWGGRSWVRKGLEAWYTLLIEALWPKQRILEVYVNIAEFGDGVYGAQAASQRFFGKDASALTAAEAARLAAVLPSPRRYSAANPGPYVQRRTGQIQRQMRQIGGSGYLERL